MAPGIRVVCPQCRVAFRIESEVEPGTTVTCCICRAEMVIPDQGSATPTFIQPTLAGSSDDRHVTLLPVASEMPTDLMPEDVAQALLRTADSPSGRYVEQGVIAQGGMGEIVLCIDRDIRRPVALKRMLTTTADDPSRRARFVEEAQVTGQLEHPNIVPVHELTRREDGTVYFTMKLVKGKSLADILAEAKQGKDAPSLGELLQVFLKVCDGVAFAHSRGVLHRDLKPANIMVGDFGEVLVMDWGLAKVKGREDIRSEDIVETSRVEKASTRTIEGSMIGTPAYMPPEQAEGKLDQIDERSDIYALGAVLYEMLALERAIQGETQMAVILNVVKGNIVPPETRAPGRNIPRELAAIAMKCLSKLRARRYRSVMELRKDISLFLEGRSVSASPDTFGQAIVKLVKRNRGVSAAVGAAAVIVIAVATFSYVRIVRALDRSVASEAKARTNEQAAVAAQKQQRTTALAASERYAKQAELAAENYRWAEAEERLGDAQAICPDGPWVPYAQGRLAQIKGDHDGAVKLLNDALKIVPGQRDIMSARDRSVSLLQRVAEARKAMKNGGKLASWQVAEKMGDTFDEAENWREAAQAYAQALQLLPPNVPRDELENKVGNARAWIACEGFYESIRALPPEQQKDRVMAKLADIHGKTIGLNTWSQRDGRLDFLQLIGPSPSYLQPLRGLPLRELGLDSSRLFDLRPLKGMPLERVRIGGNTVADLCPLRGMRLRYLDIFSTRVSDLGPLQGMPLASLDISSCPITDLSSLKGMPLQKLSIGGTRVTDLSPLKGMPIEELTFGASVSDLGPLKGMPLKKLWLPEQSAVSDLTPLQGAPLEWLIMNQCRFIRDLTPLRGMALKHLHMWDARVSDLGPLKGMPLVELSIWCDAVTDLTPLDGMEVERFAFFPNRIRKGMEVLRRMKSLKTLWLSATLVLSPEEFWKRYDAGEFK